MPRPSFCLLACLALAVSSAAQTTWFVDDNTCPAVGSGTLNDPFCSVQVAMNNAVPGDTILVFPGSYGSLDYLGKDVEVKSLEGNLMTTIGPVRFHSGEGGGAILDGFRVDTPSSAGHALECVGTSPLVTNCLFRGITSSSSGPAISVTAGGSPQFTYNVIENNTLVPDMGKGGAVYVSGSDPVFDGNIFRNNDLFADFGGGYGGAMYVTGAANLVLRDNLFEGNTATDESFNRGGALYATGSSLTLQHNTFTGNRAATGQSVLGIPGTPGRGGAIYLNQCTTTIVDQVLWGNTADEGHELYVTGGTLSISYSDVQGGLAEVGGSATVQWGVSMLDLDPLFQGPEFHLSATSPLIDAGSLVAGLPPGPTDGDLDPRLLDGDGDGARAGDMGWDEFNRTELAVSGTGALGTQLSYTTSGAPGQAYLLVGSIARDYVDHVKYGAILISLPSARLLGAGIVPGIDSASVPSDPSLIGLTVYVQALAFDPVAGSFSRVVATTFH